ncbi:MAG: hypothetical protein JKY37_26005 [Nannocystaceae bacterium]|nr:hypothetical protein [Nannocystaceae bacterium]
MPTLLATLFASGLSVGSPLAVSPGSVAPDIHGGHHVAIDGSDHVIIQTQWLCPHQCTLPLALPLPPEATLIGVSEQRSDDGSIVALVSHDRNLVFTVSVPLDTVQALGAVPLALPDRHGTHRVTFDSGPALEPNVGLGLAPKLTVATTKGVRGNPRRWLDAQLADVDSGGLVRYATQTDIVRAGGFGGSVERAETRRRRLLLLAGAMFVLVVTALAAAHRRLMRRADEERVDKLLAEEIEALGSSQ